MNNAWMQGLSKDEVDEKVEKWTRAVDVEEVDERGQEKFDQNREGWGVHVPVSWYKPPKVGDDEDDEDEDEDEDDEMGDE
jgi:regulator of RNase E activity RraB